MVKFDDDVKIKLDAPSKHKIYDMLTRGKLPKKIKRVLLLGLGHWLYASWLKAEHPETEEIVMMENAQLQFLLKDIESLDGYNIVYVEDNKYLDKLKEMEMKFDCIIMNPPYQRNLHLKIAEEAQKHLAKDGKIVSLAPDTWLSPFADMDKSSDFSKFKDLKWSNVEHIGLLSKWFDVGHTSYSCAIYELNEQGKSYDLSNDLYEDIEASKSLQITIPSKLVKSLKHKVVEYIAQDPNNSLSAHIKNGKVDETTKWTRQIPTLVGNPGERCNCIANIGSERWDRNFFKGMNNGKKMGEYKKKLSNVKNYETFNYIEFDTEEELVNWRDSNNAYFMRIICIINHNDSNLHSKWLPFMQDYSKPWDDARFYKFFNITSEEQKLIEDTMKKYEAK